MAPKGPENIRNIAFVGHNSCGKTSLVESLLCAGGALSRKGAVDAGTTVTDFDDHEKERKNSIDLACASTEAGGVLLNFVDTPGYRDYVGQVYCASVGVDCFIVVVSAEEGIRPNTRKVWQIAEAAGLPCFVVINRIDREHGDFDNVLNQIQEQLSSKCVPLTVPDSSGSSFSKVERTLANADASESVQALAESIMESVVESNDDLMERYLGGEEVSPEEVVAQCVEAVVKREIFPVFATSAEKDIGIEELLEGCSKFAPSAACDLGRTVSPKDDAETSLPVSTSAGDEFSAVVMKVVSDPFVGKLTYLRIFSGSLAQNGSFVNPHTGKSDKVGKIVKAQGKEHNGIEEAGAGDIVELVKVEGLEAFDFLSSSKVLLFTPPRIPKPMSSLAVSPKTKADEKKFAESFLKLVDEDVTLVCDRDKSTGELIVSGVSSLHLQILFERLKARFGVEVETKQPKTPYLETVSAGAEDMYRHKKQSGGSGEFAEVHLRVLPQERGEGLKFENKIFGGAISASYVQSVEKGIRALCEHGVIAGCPVVDVCIEIFDGKEHPVDSKDIAFQKAGREAFKLAFAKAKPALLEPIVDLEVTFPSEVTGDIQGDLTRRRGRPQGVDALGDFQTLKAQVPLAEVGDYASGLGSMTGGQGSYTIELSHYESVPPNVQQKIVEAYKAEQKAD